MAERPRIAVDVMGGDGGPASVLPAVQRAARHADIVAVGDAGEISRHAAGIPDLRIVHAEQRLDPNDSLSTLLRRKGATPVHLALALLAAGDVDAVVSASDTAALMALARRALDMIPGIERPAVMKRLHGVQQPFYLLDLGANIDCSARLMVQFAKIGATVARRVGGVAEPRVALLNIGTEAAKGPRRLKDCAAQLAREDKLEYVGFVEASRLFDGNADVIVCDGFAGNVALKAIEGAASMATHLLLERIAALTAEERQALQASNLLPGLRQALDPEQYNGASLVGLKGVVVKSHGSAAALGFERALEEAVRAVGSNLTGELARAFAEDQPP